MKYLVRAIFRLIARQILRRYHPVVVGVAGSVGKTATKEAIAAALMVGGRHVRKTEGSFNAEIGVPVTIMVGGQAPTRILGWLGVLLSGLKTMVGRQSYPNVLVIEMGSDKPGDLAHLLQIVQPDIGVLTSTGPEHLEFFGTIERVIAEESQIIRSLAQDKTAVVNIDDDRNRGLLPEIKCKVITYGHHPTSAVRVESISNITDPDHLPTGMIVKVSVEGNTIPIALPGVIGSHQALPIVAGIAVSRVLSDNLSEVIAQLSRYQPPPGRMRLLRGREGSIIIDDSYNASPDAVRAALETLFNLEVPGRKYVVLGQMSELGTEANRWHDEIGRLIGPKTITQLVTVGPLAKRIGQAAIGIGFPSARVANVADAEAAAAKLLPLLAPGDAILLKGSRYASLLERAVKLLLADPSRDARLLVQS